MWPPPYAALTASMQACALSGTYLRVPDWVAADAAMVHAVVRTIWHCVGSAAQTEAIWHSAFALALQKVATSGYGDEGLDVVQAQMPVAITAEAAATKRRFRMMREDYDLRRVESNFQPPQHTDGFHACPVAARRLDEAYRSCGPRLGVRRSCAVRSLPGFTNMLLLQRFSLLHDLRFRPSAAIQTDA